MDRSLHASAPEHGEGHISLRRLQLRESAMPASGERTPLLHRFQPINACVLLVLMLAHSPYAVPAGKPRTPGPAVAPGAARSDAKPVPSGSSAQTAVMTNVDVLRLLELGVPASIIVERIRANQTHFTKLDELVTAIRRYDTSAGGDPRFLSLVSEISLSQYRGGAPCRQAGVACPPISADTPAAASTGADEAIADPPPESAQAPAASPGIRPAAPVADPPPARPSRGAMPASAAIPQGETPVPTPAPVPGAAPIAPPAAAVAPVPSPVVAPAPVPAAPAPVGALVAALEAKASPSARAFAARQEQQMAEEYERNKYRNPNLVTDPLRVRFDPTEVGEHVEKDIAVTIKHNVEELQVLSIQLSRTSDLDQPTDAFTLVQPDLQCPEVASSQNACHLSVQFHPVRDGFASAYVKIITEGVCKKNSDGSLVDPKCDPDHPPIYFDRIYVQGTGYVADVASLDGTGPLSNQPGLRSVMGFDISGASNAATQQKFFLEFDINAPIGFAHFGNRSLRCADNPTLPACRRDHVTFAGDVVCAGGYRSLPECENQSIGNTVSVFRSVPCTGSSPLPECKDRTLTRIDGTYACKDYAALAECGGKRPSDAADIHRTVSCLQFPNLPDCEQDTVQLERRDPLSRPLWFFLNPRITSVPQSPTGLGSLNIESISNEILGNEHTTNLVQGMDVQGGMEYFLIKPRQGLPLWSVVKNAHARTGVAIVGGLGFVTPFSPPDKTTQEFTINSTILAQYPDAGKPQNDPDGNPVTPTIIAFVNKDRTRFFRRYYAGLRLKTYFFTDRMKGECDDPRQAADRCERLMNLFPGVLDFTVGKDEAVTGGRFSNWLLRLDAVYPLPFNPAFHIFGGANIVFGRNTTTLPLVLEPPQQFLNLSDPHVFVQALDPPNRDTYRIGVGVDLLQIIKGKASKPAAATEPATAATN